VIGKIVLKMLQDGPSTAKASPYPRFYNYDPELNRRSCNYRNPHLTRDKATKAPVTLSDYGRGEPFRCLPCPEKLKY